MVSFWTAFKALFSDGTAKARSMGVDSKATQRQILVGTDGKPQVDASIAALPLPAGAATEKTIGEIKTIQTDGTQLARMMVSDGAGKQVQALGEVTGKIQCDVKTSELPTGAATDAEVKKLLAESTFTTWADAKASTLAKASSQTDGSQKTQVVDSLGADMGGNFANLDAKMSDVESNTLNIANNTEAIAKAQTDGTAKTQICDSKGADVGGNLDAKLSTLALDTSVNFEARTTVPVTWAANDGSVEVECVLPWDAGDEVDLVGVHGALSASPGAATYTVRASDTTGWTPGDYEIEGYTSDLNIAVADPVADSIPNTPSMFTLGAAKKIFWRIVPNAGTTTGSLRARFVRRRTA